MTGISRMSAIVLMAWLSLGNICWANAELHLQFHMGLGSPGNMTWIGTVANKGDQPPGSAFIVITPVDEQCVVGSPVFYPLPSIAPGAQREARLPFKVSSFHHYRMTLQAFDAQGFPVPFIDDYAEVLASREKEEVEYCRQKISKSSS